MDPNIVQQGTLSQSLGIEWHEWGPGNVTGGLEVTPALLAPNGFLHAASIVALADTACGVGCMASLPEGANSFATLEIKTNFLGTARDGRISVRASLVHGGRMTQVWDAEVHAEGRDGPIALFRCTQMILYPQVKS